jgi:hypothetical protein
VKANIGYAVPVLVTAHAVNVGAVESPPPHPHPPHPHPPPQTVIVKVGTVNNALAFADASVTLMLHSEYVVPFTSGANVTLFEPITAAVVALTHGHTYVMVPASEDVNVNIGVSVFIDPIDHADKIGLIVSIVTLAIQFTPDQIGCGIPPASEHKQPSRS